ncbi:flagellar biosynthesis protein FlgA [Micromonospora sp. NPDC049047]|uniref:flagellar biosynthesis protein FlgA n=1 Tax=Micromonospora sp. NPDC049047 TaxID=3155645 RepID=UPI0033CE7DD0
MGDPDSARALRPLRRPRLPARPALFRAGLVAALLGLAAAVLHTPPGCPPAAAPGPAAVPTRATATAGQPADGRATTDGRPDGSGTGGPLPLPSGAVGVPVRLAEPATLAVVRRGSRVDLLAAAPGGASPDAALLAPAALVLDVLGADVADGSAALYLALRPDQAQRTVGLPEGTRFAVVVRN